MKISDLKVGHLVQVRDTIIPNVVDGKLARVNTMVGLFGGLKEGTPVEQVNGFEVLWERQDPKKSQIKELITKLQGQLNDAQEELKKAS